MDAVLHRIEALPGSGRYAVTFTAGGVEQTATVQILGEPPDHSVDVAEASLPPGWTRDGELFCATADAVRAVDAARRMTPTASALSDVPGGWDVSLGNVVPGADGVPVCTAHGAMQASSDVFRCTDCGSAAIVG